MFLLKWHLRGNHLEQLGFAAEAYRTPEEHQAATVALLCVDTRYQGAREKVQCIVFMQSMTDSHRSYVSGQKPQAHLY
jgi:hypothetical protein